FDLELSLMAKSKKPLKAALQSQQTRMKTKQKAAQAAQTAELMARKSNSSKKSNAKGKGKAESGASASSNISRRRQTIPFLPTEKILLIGEGNFSFAHALIHDAPAVLEHLPPRNVTATAYDSEEECYSKYPEAEELVSRLRAAGSEVLFSVDTTKLEKIAAFKGRTWDKIVWNFPHAGKGIADQDRNILSNQLLLLGFLRSAAGCLTRGPFPQIFAPRKRRADDVEDDEGEQEDLDEDLDMSSSAKAASCRGSVLITLRNVSPYTQWDLPRLAKNPPPPASSGHPGNPRYTLLRSFEFQRSTWSGYAHRMTKGERAGGTGTTGVGGEDRTWQFCLRDS
ncbi:unnamed protein product, partial [Mycena citricolor]